MAPAAAERPNHSSRDEKTARPGPANFFAAEGVAKWSRSITPDQSLGPTRRETCMCFTSRSVKFAASAVVLSLSASVSCVAFAAPNNFISKTGTVSNDFGISGDSGEPPGHPTPNNARFILAADGVPQFNIERGCKVDNTASSLDTGLDETLKNCVRDERQARDQLQTQWSQFAPSDRVMCTSETTQGDGVPPSYVELLTCLQGQQLARKMKE